MLRDYPNNPVVVVGDFNARLQRLGDHASGGSAVRRRWMEAWLNDPDWMRLEPTTGIWTTIVDNGDRGGGGRGVTDLAFLNGHAVQRVSNLVVHEDDNTVDSDHRLLTFSIRMEAKFQKPPFERLNIRKLFEKRAEYKRAIDESSFDTLDQLMTLRDVLTEAVEAREIWSWEKRQEMADLASDTVTDWLVGAADKVVGKVRFKGGAIHAPMIEDHIPCFEEKLREAKEYLETGSNLSAGEIFAAKESIRMWRKIVKNAT
ncbi:hypothetical protein HDU98_005595, partial [Podochytrium sp. JEL0797]